MEKCEQERHERDQAEAATQKTLIELLAKVRVCACVYVCVCYVLLVLRIQGGAELRVVFAFNRLLVCRIQSSDLNGEQSTHTDALRSTRTGQSNICRH